MHFVYKCWTVDECLLCLRVVINLQFNFEHAWVRSNDCRNVGLCVNTGLHISHTVSRTAERKMSRSAKDDDSLLVHDCAASQLTTAVSHITHTLAVIQKAIKRPVVGWITDVHMTGTSSILYSRTSTTPIPISWRQPKKSSQSLKLSAQHHVMP